MSSLFYGAIDLLDDDGPYHAQVGTGFGAWQSIQSETTSPFIDGAAVSGDATANREIVLLVDVEATTRAGLIAACEALIGEANKQDNTLTWTADGAAPMVYDTFRVRSPNRTDNDSEQFFVRSYTLTIPAFPFARSAVTLTPTAIAPVAATMPSLAAPAGFYTDTASDYIPQSTTGASLASGVMSSTLGGLTAVSGCTVSVISGSLPPNDTRITVTSAPGIARSTSTIATTAAAVIVGVTIDSTPAGGQLGVAWFNGATLLYVDWGLPTLSSGEYVPLWAASERPAAATHVGYQIRLPSNGTYRDVEIWTIPSALSGDAAMGVAVDLTAPFDAPKKFGNAAPTNWRKDKFTAVDISTGTNLVVWARRNYFGYPQDFTVRVKLHSGNVGAWSAFDFTISAADTWTPGDWRALVAVLATPTTVSAVGAANLTAVNAVSIEQKGTDDNGSGVDIGAIGSGIATGAGTGIRGTVFDLAAIMGSAPAPASAHLWSSTALSDLIVVTLDALDGPPMVPIASSAAALPAPANYKGVYRLLASRTDATAVTTPQLVLTQKIGATTVATVTLPGKSRPGNHYVDFGTVPLPLVAVPDENATVNYTVAITPSSANWGELLPLDVNNSLVMLEQISPPRKHVWIDKPEIIVGLGDVWVGTADRTDASAPLQAVDQSSPFTVKAPNVKLLVYSTAAGPSAAVSYQPHYLDGLA